MNYSIQFSEFLQNIFTSPIVNEVFLLYTKIDKEKYYQDIINRIMTSLVQNTTLQNNRMDSNVFNNSPFLKATCPSNIDYWYPSIKGIFNIEVFKQHQTMIFLMDWWSKACSLASLHPDEWISEVKIQCFYLFLKLSSQSNESIVLPYFYHDLIKIDWIRNSLNYMEINLEVRDMFAKLVTDLTFLIHDRGILSPHLHELLDKYIYLIKFNKVKQLIVSLPQWNPKCINENDGQEFQIRSHLGQILGLSIFTDDVTMSNNTRKCLQYIDSDDYQQAMNMLPSLWHKQFTIVKIFLVKTRESCLNFLFKSIQLNMKRSALHYEEELLSGEGFINNVNAVLQKLVKKINISKVDFEHLSRDIFSESAMSFGWLLKDETRVAATATELERHSESLRRDSQMTTCNYHTFCFYLTMVSHNISFVSGLDKQKRRNSIIAELETYKTRIEEFMEAQNSPVLISQLNGVNEKIEFQKTALFFSNIVFKSKEYQEGALGYYTIVTDFLQNTNYNINYLPEFLFENISDILNTVLKDNIDLLSSPSNVLDLTLHVINNSHLFKSPYLVSKFVQAISNMLSTVTDNKLGNFQYILMKETITNGVFVNSLVKYFVDVEKTGDSSEFYAKFNIRMDITVVLNILWIDVIISSTVYMLDSEMMTRFVNLACNDITYLADEAFGSIRKIKENTENTDSMSGDDQTSLEQEMAQFEESVPGDLQILDMYMEVFVTLSEQCKAFFLTDEIVHKVTAMLNHFLEDLLGERSFDLRIKDAEKYDWEPQTILKLFMKLFLNLNSAEFVAAISKEERYFSPENLEYIAKRFLETSLISVEDRETFLNIKDQVLKLREEALLEQDYDDVPEEYLDPIMSTIMKDPVLIPGSSVIVDRNVIKRHLLNDSCDPFNRQPLRYEDVIPHPILKKEIENWLLKKKLKN